MESRRERRGLGGVKEGLVEEECDEGDGLFQSSVSDQDVKAILEGDIFTGDVSKRSDQGIEVWSVSSISIWREDKEGLSSGFGYCEEVWIECDRGESWVSGDCESV